MKEQSVNQWHVTRTGTATLLPSKDFSFGKKVTQKVTQTKRGYSVQL